MSRCAGSTWPESSRQPGRPPRSLRLKSPAMSPIRCMGRAALRRSSAHRKAPRPRRLNCSIRRWSSWRAAGKIASGAGAGAGAAGGLGFGMMAFFGAQLRRGIDIVIDAVGLEKRLRGADLCITGEGKLNSQSLAGKTPVGVARVCAKLGVPCIAIAGQVDVGAATAAAAGLMASFSICRGPMLLDEAVTRCGTPCRCRGECHEDERVSGASHRVRSGS